MICLSFCEQFAYYLQITQNEEGISFNVANKIESPAVFNPAQISNPNFREGLSRTLNELKEKLPVQERELSVSIPSSMVDIVVNQVDFGLSDKEVGDVLQWQFERRLGAIKEKKLLQHYPIANPDDENTRNFLTISYYKNYFHFVLNKARVLFLKRNYDL